MFLRVSALANTILAFTVESPDTSNDYKHLSNHKLQNCNLHTHAQFLTLLEFKYDY